MFLPGFSCNDRWLRSACRVCLSLLAAVGISIQFAHAQSEKNKDAQKVQEDAITLKTHLVTMDVIVKDKRGRYVTDLKAEDFVVLENGTRQQVEFFDPPLASGNESSHPNSVDQVTSVTTGGKSTNILSLVLDGATTDLANLKQVREGMLKYIRERIVDSDTVALFGISTDLRLLQPFTQDKAKVIAAVENAYALTALNKNLERSNISEDIERARADLSSLGGVSLQQGPSAATQGRIAAQAMIAARALEQFLKLRSQLSAQHARPVLAALAAIAAAQRSIPGKKTVVLFSQGFVTPTILDWQAQSVIDIANRANVAIYIIDSAGLRTSGPLSTSPVPDAPLAGVAATGSTDDRMRTVGGESVFDNVRHEGLNREYDILYRISGDTGGEFIKGTNDLAKGLDRIDQEIRSRYTVAYYSTDPNFDGGFRRVKIEVHRPDLNVVSRSGYHADAGENLALLSPDEKKLLANLGAIEASSAIPLFVELSPLRFKGGHYVVPLSIEMPPSAVRFERKVEKQHAHFDVFGVIREAPDKIIARLGADFDMALTAKQYQAILNNNIFFRQDMELAAGAYDIELIVRDRLSGKMAARREKLVLPPLDAEFSMSSVVLSRHAEPAKNRPEAQPDDVFNQAGVQIRPLPSRKFNTADNLIIFFELYNAAVNMEMGKPLVRVTVTLMRDNTLVLGPIDFVLAEAAAEPVPHLTFAKYISLARLTAGKYTAMIAAKDMVTHKLATQQASFVVTQ